MSSIFKRTIKRWMKDGKRVKAGTPGATAVSKESDVYYGEYTDAETGQRKTVALFSDRKMSQWKAAQLERQSERREVGYSDRYTEAAARPIAEHLDAYFERLADKKNTGLHVETQRSRCEKALAGASRLPQITPDRVSENIHKLKLGAQTHNHYVRAVKGFTRWLVKWQRLKADPLTPLEMRNTDTDIRHKRRSLTATDFQKFLSTTQQSKRVDEGNDWRFDGSDRHTLYLVAGLTGLRASEIASLTVSSFDFGSLQFKIRATMSKNRHEAILPIHPKLVEVIQSYIERKGLTSKDNLFPGSWAARKLGGKMVKRDLAEAEIDYKTDEGCFDFHSLRGQFVTSLAEHGVSPQTAKELARHSTIQLTVDVYTRLQNSVLHEAMKKLPSPI